jgi:hypothetical protein
VEEIDVPFGLGSRHLAAASVSQRLGVVAIVVSESAIVRVFHGGELIAEIIPELWLFRRHLQPLLPGPVTEQHVEDLMIFTPETGERAVSGQIGEALELSASRRNLKAGSEDLRPAADLSRS